MPGILAYKLGKFGYSATSEYRAASAQAAQGTQEHTVAPEESDYHDDDVRVSELCRG